MFDLSKRSMVQEQHIQGRGQSPLIFQGSLYCGFQDSLVDDDEMQNSIRYSDALVRTQGPSHEAAVAFGVVPTCSVICREK
jgi:hypothetical protein